MDTSEASTRASVEEGRRQPSLREARQPDRRTTAREKLRPKTRPDEASPPKIRLDEAAGAKKREARAGCRYIPSSVRERLLERASYQCEFRGPGGVRCTARTRLEVDHIEPVGKGGSCGEENLRMLCRGHNLLAAAREFGEEFMRRKIEGRKRRAAPGQLQSRGRGFLSVSSLAGGNMIPDIKSPRRARC